MENDYDNMQTLQNNIEFVNNKVTMTIDVLQKLNTKVDNMWGEFQKMNDINSAFNERTLDFIEKSTNKIAHQEGLIMEIIDLSKKLSERILEIQEIVDILSNLNGIDPDIAKKVKSNKDAINKITLDMDYILDKISAVGFENLTEQEKNFLNNK